MPTQPPDERPVLPGTAKTDYERYMRTDELLALQRGPGERVHHDELLFQTVHQSTELWLKLACAEVSEATDHINDGNTDEAVRLLGRSALAARLLTGQLDMLGQMAPWAFHHFRTELGNGSGLQSPGWRQVRHVTPALGTAFDKRCRDAGTELVELYQRQPTDPLYRLADALCDWDEGVNAWRVRHYLVAVRSVGAGATGTRGNPVDMLNRLIHHRFFPELWRVRDDLTNLWNSRDPRP